MCYNKYKEVPMRKIIFYFVIFLVLIITGCDNNTTVIEPKIEELFIKTLPRNHKLSIRDKSLQYPYLTRSDISLTRCT